MQPLLEPGESIQTVFVAQSGVSPYYFFLTYLLAFWSKYVVIAATDRRIVVAKASAWRPAAPKEIEASFPRETRIGPISGGLWSKFELGGTRYWVHRRLLKDAQAVDTAGPPSPAPA
jgi:hypothetical protein